MGRKITVGEGHTVGLKTDHRNGKTTPVENQVEVRPVMDGYHNETVRDRYRFGRDFVTIFTDDLNDLLSQGELKFDEWKVLLYLIANLQKNNLAVTNLDIISQNVGIDRTRVSRSLTGLKKRNIIVEMKMSHTRGSGPVTSVFQISLVNPNLCFNGQIQNYKKEIVAYPKLTKTDGKTYLNPHAESERQKQKRLEEQRYSLFPEFYEEQDKQDNGTTDPGKGDIAAYEDEFASAIESFENESNQK